MLVSDHIRNRLLRMIADYQRWVAQFISAAERQYGVFDLFAAWQGNRIPLEGQLDDVHATTFTFHGFGCAVESEGVEVDFDFGPDGRYDGFDVWRLLGFATSQPDKYPEFQNQAIIERALEELMHTDVIYSPRWPPSPHLLYLTGPKG